MHPVEARYHPLFEQWLVELAETDEEIFGEVMALLTALEEHGRDLDDETKGTLAEIAQDPAFLHAVEDYVRSTQHFH